MLGKLLKYELRAMGRILVPLYLVMIAACALFAGNIKLTEAKGVASIFEKFTLLTGALMIIAMIGVTIVMIILIIQRFYKNLLGTEGYQMFTLPATTLEQILSKMISAFIWVVLGVISGGIAGIIMISFFADLGEFLKEFSEALGMIFTDSNITLQVCLVLLMLILSVMESLSKVYAAIATGHQMNSHRLLFSVLAYLAFSLLEALLALIPFVRDLISGSFLTVAKYGALPKYLLIELIGILFYGAIAWILLDRRLNLE